MFLKVKYFNFLFFCFSFSFPQNKNILSAVLTLVQELDRTSLLTLRKEIDQQLEDLDDDVENNSQDKNLLVEEKEPIVD